MDTSRFRRPDDPLRQQAQAAPTGGNYGAPSAANPQGGTTMTNGITCRKIVIGISMVCLLFVSGLAYWFLKPDSSLNDNIQAITEERQSADGVEPTEAPTDVPHEGGIEGYVFLDNDGDGQLDLDEPGIEGITIRIEGDLEKEVESDIAGGYGFFELPSGDYEVIVEPGDDYIAMIDSVTVSITATESARIDFALVEPHPTTTPVPTEEPTEDDEFVRLRREEYQRILQDSNKLQGLLFAMQVQLDIVDIVEDKCDEDDVACQAVIVFKANATQQKLSADQISKLQTELASVKNKLDKWQRQHNRRNNTTTSTSSTNSTNTTTTTSTSDEASEWMCVHPNLNTWWGTNVLYDNSRDDHYVWFDGERRYDSDGWRVMVNMANGKVTNVNGRCVEEGTQCHSNGKFDDAGCTPKDDDDPDDPDATPVPQPSKVIEWSGAYYCMDGSNFLHSVWIEGARQVHLVVRKAGQPDKWIKVDEATMWLHWEHVDVPTTFILVGEWDDGKGFEFYKFADPRTCTLTATPRPTSTPAPTATPQPSTTPRPTVTPQPSSTPAPTATPYTPVPSSTWSVPPSPTSSDPTATQQPTATKRPPTATDVPPQPSATATQKVVDPTPEPTATMPSYCTEPVNYLESARFTEDLFGTLVRKFGHHRLFGVVNMIYRETIFDPCQTLVVDAYAIEDLAPGGRIMNFPTAPLNEGCVLAYRQGSPNGRLDVHIRVSDGQASHVTVETGISTSQAIAVVRNKLRNMKDENDEGICEWDNGDGIWQRGEIIIYQLGVHGPY